MARAFMFMGTGSDVGKSTVVAGLCRVFARRGLRVRPFKPQNMSNNAAVTADGGEIGRAQALQALACGVPASVHMNPVLLKPQGETGSQMIVRGAVAGTMRAAEYQARKGELLPTVLESFRHLQAEADLVLVEGAGSAAEVNLRAGDIANMGFAEAADLPVVLVADIDRGGVIASLVGTWALLPDSERARIEGFIINKFRGDLRLFDEGLEIIRRATGMDGLGVVGWFPEAARLPAEDSVGFARRATAGAGERPIRIAVPMLGAIANMDDLDPLRLEPSVALDLVPPGRALPGDCDLVLLPGSKATLADLAMLRAEGWDIDIQAHVRRGGRVIGLCGGYQMLGRRVEDPDGIEGPPGGADGLGLLDVTTVLAGPKVVRPASGLHIASGCPVTGYEIHMGRSEGPACARPLLELGGRPDGAVSADGRIAGTYLHGLFASGAARRVLLSEIRTAPLNGQDHGSAVEAALDALADHLEACAAPLIARIWPD